MIYIALIPFGFILLDFIVTTIRDLMQKPIDTNHNDIFQGTLWERKRVDK